MAAADNDPIELRRFALDIASRLKFFETSTDAAGMRVTTEHSITADEVLAAARGFEGFLQNG